MSSRRFSSMCVCSQLCFEVSGSAGAGDVEQQYPTQLRQLYDLLSPAGNKNLDDVERQGTGTSTGYDVDSLRFENWKAVNRLLFEAEVHEKEKEMRMLDMVMRESKGMLVEVARKEKEENVGWDLAFYNEEEAKKKVRGVVKGRREGREGWRREEMEVRGRLAKVRPEGREEGVVQAARGVEEVARGVEEVANDMTIEDLVDGLRPERKD